MINHINVLFPAQLNTKKNTLTNSDACPTVAALLNSLMLTMKMTAPRNQTVSSLGRSAATPPLPVSTTRTVFSLELGVAKHLSPRMCACPTRRIAKSSERIVVLESQLNALRMTCSLVIVAQQAHHHQQQLQPIRQPLFLKAQPDRNDCQDQIIHLSQPHPRGASPHAEIGILPGWIKSQ